jgi:HlyD family secretion protein
MLKSELITRELAQADLIKAKDDLEIQKSQNESDIAYAKSSLQYSEMALEQWLKGDQDRILQDLKGRIVTAEADEEEAKEKLEEGEKKLKQQAATDKQVQTLRRRLEATQLSLEQNRVALQVFEKYTKPHNEADLRAKLVEARKILERTEQQCKAKESQTRLMLDSRKAVCDKEVARYKEIEEEIQKCKLVAPRDGTVFYHVPERSVVGFAPQPIVAAGEPVREGQKLLYIPDLDQMQVVVRIPEALIVHVRPGMSAVVHADAFPDRTLHGQVRHVSATPSPRDWMTPDEKVYAVTILLKGDTTGFRPGMSATCIVPFGKPNDNVLTAPVRALIGRPSPNQTVSCLVLTADGPAEREVVVGYGNEELAEIKSGLHEGDEVIVNPQLLLSNIRDRIRFLGRR